MIPLNLDAIINAISGIASPLIKDKLQRNETVIKLLKQFNLAPEHPPADFSGVYAYALVEYGVGKPKPFLELFRHEQIKQAFHKALDHNNPSILLSEVDTFVGAYALGDEIKTLGLDIRREVAAFATVFIEVAKRSRTPSDALMSQQIGSLHRKIATITEQLDRLPTLEGIRTEMARLASQNYPALAAAATAVENNCKAVALAQQMRGWFETLGYRFEKHEVWAEYFEWIINIQGRRGYDRILVRGIEGEAGVKDVAALREEIQKQRTDEGWLVSARRISRAAREQVKNEDYSKVFCYTFDELLDQDADFSAYLNWLETEVKRRGIDTQYVPLACTKEEIDSVTKRQIAVSRYDEEDGWIDGYIDLWLDDPAKEHISVLGEFGTGKTWFAFHYAWVALQRYRDAQKRGVERPRLPLVITLRDFAKALNVENVLAGFFFTQHNIRLNSDVFDQLNRMGKLLLIFDGFDEMAARVDRQEMINNFWELAKVVVPGSKVILTCRTEHFPEAKEGRALLNAELQASTANLTGETPQFEVLELEKFNDDQIRQVLSFQASPNTVEQVMGNSQLLDLARRPVMTELILEALPDIEAGLPVDISRVYLYAVRHKMERDIKAERTFTSLADKLYFLCELSWEMLSTDHMSLNYRLFPDRIRRLFGSVVQEEKDLDHWHYDMMGQTMLIRDADGDYTPAHRSLLEFFVAYKFAAELGALAEDFTELARSRSRLNNSAAPIDYTWSGYFAPRDAIALSCGNSLAPLKGFIREPLEKLRETVGRAQLTKAVIDLLVPMLGNNESLIKVIEATRGKSEDEVGYVGGNAATLLVKIDKKALDNKDLSQAVIIGANFSDASLRGVNFAEANLANTIFPKVFGAIFAVAFSPDGKLFATGDASCKILIWRCEDSQPIAVCEGHKDWIRSIAFSPDGKVVASASYDRTIKLWNILTGECLKTLQGHGGRVNSVTISSNNKILVSGSSDNTIKIWNVHTGECFKTLQGHTSRIHSVTISPDSLILASSSRDKTIKIWNIYTGECQKTLLSHSDSVNSVTISSDGATLASSSADTTIKLWSIHTGECQKTLQGHTNEVRTIAFSSNNKTLISGSYDKTIKLWDIGTGECLNILQAHTDGVRSVAINPNATTLISGGNDRTIRQWDLLTGECVNVLQGYSGAIRSVAISPSEATLASSSEEPTVKLWNIRTGECLKNLLGHTSRVNSVVFSPNGKTLATGSYDRTIKLWDAYTGECLKTFNGHSGGVNSVVFSLDGNILISAGGDITVKLWDIETGECLKTLQEHSNWLWSVAVSPDGTTIASGGDDKVVKLWNISTGIRLNTLEGHQESIWSLAMSSDGKTLASGSDDNTVKLWDISTGRCLKTLRGHISRIEAVAISTNGQILVSGSFDRTIKLWDINTGECLRTLHGHTQRVRSVAISFDSTLIFSGGYDETIKIWNANTGQCLNTFINKPYAGMNITGITGLTKSEKSTLKALGAVEDE
ncbi:MAG: NACHT domain-containing protein [Scytonema sp. PMC 1069.18]|nr:NACHT domain-containing protein [Scytonema sp. PMC 1069.18]MEC4882787.1 NACHT domain-containing protein [Scytonema sp. PMC 1070.18]